MCLFSGSGKQCAPRTVSRLQSIAAVTAGPPGPHRMSPRGRALEPVSRPPSGKAHRSETRPVPSYVSGTLTAAFTGARVTVSVMSGLVTGALALPTCWRWGGRACPVQ